MVAASLVVLPVFFFFLMNTPFDSSTRFLTTPEVQGHQIGTRKPCDLTNACSLWDKNNVNIRYSSQPAEGWLVDKTDGILLFERKWCLLQIQSSQKVILSFQNDPR